MPFHTPRKRGRATDDDGYSPLSSNGSVSSRKRATGSPSARYLAELSLQNEHYNRELFNRLEEEEAKTGKVHRDALLAAARAHEQVRREAQLQQQRELQKVEEQERRIRDADRELQIQREIEAESRRADDQRIEELERRAKEQRARHEREAEERKSQREREDREHAEEEARARDEQRKKADEEAQRREAEAKDKAAREASKPAAPTTTTTTTKSAAPAPATDGPQAALESEHKQYLDIHARMKAMRKAVWEQLKTQPALKKQVGDWRRDINARISQATGAKGGTTAPRLKISEALNAALRLSQPAVNIRDFLLPAHLPADATDSNSHVSGVFIYLLSIFVKAVVSQWHAFAGADIARANAPGIIASAIFAHDTHRWHGVSLIDMLLAKLHKACPVLFGIHGPETTDSGKRRLGWLRNKDTNAWISEQQHGDRMAGLGAGFSSIALRVFPPTSPLRNPYPPAHWWAAAARIVDTPAAAVGNTHATVLKGMIEAQAQRVVDIFRPFGLLLLRAALVDFPPRAPVGAARTGLETLPAILQRNGLAL